jgi:hypothetical protein
MLPCSSNREPDARWVEPFHSYRKEFVRLLGMPEGSSWMGCASFLRFQARDFGGGIRSFVLRTEYSVLYSVLLCKSTMEACSSRPGHGDDPIIKIRRVLASLPPPWTLAPPCMSALWSLAETRSNRLALEFISTFRLAIEDKAESS